MEHQSRGRRRVLVSVSLLCLVAALGVLLWKLVDEPRPVAQLAKREAAPDWRLRRVPQVLTPSGEVTSVAEPEVRTGVITGRVVAAPSGAPIAAAELGFAVGAGITTVRGSDDGSFRFESTETGLLRLASVRATGFFPFAPELGNSRIVFRMAPGVHIRDVVLVLEERRDFKGRVISSTDQPVADARVTVTELGNVEAELEPLNLRYQTDAQGSFTFQAPAGAILEATHPGFLPGRADVSVAVQATRSLTIRLPAQPANGEREVGISGRVVGPNGEPVEGARVVIRDRIGSGAQQVVQTERGGAFAFGAVPWERSQVIASAAGHGSAAITDVPRGARDVVVRLSKAVAVAGRVEDADGNPVTAFSVVAEVVVGPMNRRRVATSTSYDRDGRFTLEDIPPGPLALTAIAQVGAPSREKIVAISAEQPPPEIVLTLRRGRVLRGDVAEDGDRRPVSGARVTVSGSPNEGDVGLSVQHAAITDESGRFQLRGLSAGRASLIVWAPDFNGRVVPVTIPENTDPEAVHITLGRVPPGQTARLELIGIGAVLAPDGDVLRITKVVEGGGAYEAGLKPGDAIVSVDDQVVVEVGFAESVQRILGPEGSPVRLGLRRGNDSNVISLTVIRRKLRV